jgi:hypothetical protein
MVALGPAAQGYHFFTPAYLYLYSPLPDQVLIDFAAQQRSQITFLEGIFSVALFKGLDRPDTDKSWNYKLWAIEDQYWEAFVSFVCSVVLIQRHPKKLVWCPTIYDLTILDPVFRQRQSLIGAYADLPTLEVGVFGLVSAERQLYLEPGQDLFAQPLSRWTHGPETMKGLQSAVPDEPQDFLNVMERHHHQPADPEAS